MSIGLYAKLVHLYNCNKDFKNYVEKHKTCYNKTFEDTLKTKVVISYAENLIDKSDKQDWILGK